MICKNTRCPIWKVPGRRLSELQMFIITLEHPALRVVYHHFHLTIRSCLVLTRKFAEVCCQRAHIDSRRHVGGVHERSAAILPVVYLSKFSRSPMLLAILVQYYRAYYLQGALTKSVSKWFDLSFAVSVRIVMVVHNAARVMRLSGAREHWQPDRAIAHRVQRRKHSLTQLDT